MEIGPNHRLRLLPFGYARRLKTAGHARPGIHADEIHEIGAEQIELRHNGVVIFGLGQVAIAAGLGLGAAHGMREMRCEGL